VQSRDERQVRPDAHQEHQAHRGELNTHPHAGHQEHPDGHPDHRREGHRAAAESAYRTTTSADRHRAAAGWACQTWKWGVQAVGPAGGQGAGRRDGQAQRQPGGAQTAPARWTLPVPRRLQDVRRAAAARRRWAGCW